MFLSGVPGSFGESIDLYNEDWQLEKPASVIRQKIRCIQQSVQKAFHVIHPFNDQSQPIHP